VTIYEDARMQNDLEILCWKGKHLAWMGGFGLPMVSICFAIPIGGIVFMILMRNSANKDWF